MAATPQATRSPVACHADDGPSSTARVLDFVCLFTHDLRRKQKRWQDGRLKFHDFNKRIMVYDERGNFIGDTHWREDYEFGEDEEVTLERGGVIVQVQEYVGSRSQDLSELVDKRLQEKAQRQSAAIARHARSTPNVLSPIVTRATAPHSQARQAPLHSILGPPTGHHGRALIPIESPYEQRQRQNPHQNESPRPIKRRKREPSPSSKSGYAQSLFGATLTLSGRPMSSNPVRRLPSSIEAQRRDSELPPSSDQSIPAVDEDEVREVAHTAEYVPQRALPLSEQTVMVTNTNRNISDALVGKDARSKANVPTLLRHRKPPDENIARSLTKATKSKLRVAQATEHEHSQLPTTEETVARNERTDVVSTDPERTKRQPSTERLSQEKSRQRSNTRTSIDGGTIRRSRSEYESSETQLGSSQRVIDLTESEYHTKAPVPVVAQKHQIEYRIKTSKRRGLLMVSEKNFKKAKRRTESSNPDGLNDLHSTTKTASSDGVHLLIPEESRPQGNGNQNSSLSKPRILQYSEPERPENDDPAITQGSRWYSCSGDANTSDPARSRLPDQSRARMSSPVRKGGPSKRPDYLPSSRIPGAPMPPRLPQEKEDTNQEDAGYCDKSFEETAPEIQRPRKSRRPSRNIPTQERNEAYQLEASAAFDMEKSVKASAMAEDQATHDTSADASRLRTKGSEQKFPPRKPEKAPPPRLAPLARRSIRSKEVFGLFPDSDDESSTEVEITKSRSTESLTRLNKGSSREPIPPGWTSTTTEGTRFTGHRCSTISQPRDVTRDADAVLSDLAGAENSTTGPGQPDFRLLASAASTSKDPTSKAPKDRHRKAESHQPIGMAAVELCSPQQNPEVSWLAPRGAGTDTSAIDGSGVSGKGQGMRSPGKHAGRDDLQERHASWDCDQSVPSHVLQNDVHEDPSALKRVEPKAIPKILNPATRGKKAARPSDAAGQVPESILPADGSGCIIRQVGRPPPAVAEKGAKQSATSLPGFSRANGGPWSREAHDLFEYRRPG